MPRRQNLPCNSFFIMTDHWKPTASCSSRLASMRASYACLICVPHMCDSYACLICVPHMRASYVWLICVPHMRASYACLICVTHAAWYGHTALLSRGVSTTWNSKCTARPPRSKPFHRCHNGYLTTMNWLVNRKYTNCRSSAKTIPTFLHSR